MLGPKRKDDFEPYWQDENDGLCIVEFSPTDDPEARLFATEIIGYLVSYANLTNTRSRALLGDPDASAYELLFSFSSPEEKNEFLNLVRSNEDMGKDYIIELTSSLHHSFDLRSCYEVARTASTMCLAEMPKALRSSSGLPECGISRTARSCDLAGATLACARAERTASPIPPSAQ